MGDALPVRHNDCSLGESAGVSKGSKDSPHLPLLCLEQVELKHFRDCFFSACVRLCLSVSLSYVDCVLWCALVSMFVAVEVSMMPYHIVFIFFLYKIYPVFFALVFCQGLYPLVCLTVWFWVFIGCSSTPYRWHCRCFFSL